MEEWRRPHEWSPHELSTKCTIKKGWTFWKFLVAKSTIGVSFTSQCHTRNPTLKRERERKRTLGSRMIKNVFLVEKREREQEQDEEIQDMICALNVQWKRLNFLKIFRSKVYNWCKFRRYIEAKSTIGTSFTSQFNSRTPSLKREREGERVKERKHKKSEWWKNKF